MRQISKVAPGEKSAPNEWIGGLATPYAFRTNRYAQWVVGVLGFTSMIAFLDRQIINLLVEPIKHDLHLTDVSISLLEGFALVMFQTVLGIPIGRLADGGSRRQIILIGIVCWALACLGCGFAGSFSALFFMRMLIGGGESTFTPSSYSMLADYFPRDRLGRAMSVLQGISYVGAGLAFVWGGWLLARLASVGDVVLPLVGPFHPWQLAFMAAALPGLLCFALVLTVREPPRSRGAADPVDGGLPRMSVVLRYIYHERRSIGAVYLGFAFFASEQIALGAWLPTFFVRTYGWTASEFGYIFGIYCMTVGPLGSFAGGWLADHLARRGYADANLRAGVIGAACALPLLMAFPLMPSGRWSMLVLAPVTFLGTMPFGAGVSALPLISPNRMRGQIVALYLLILSLVGQSLGPTFVAGLTDYVFKDPMQLRYSLPIATGILLVIAILIIVSGLKSFGHALEKAQRGDGPSSGRARPPPEGGSTGGTG